MRILPRLRQLFHCLFRWHRPIDGYEQYYYHSAHVTIECECGRIFWKDPEFKLPDQEDAT
jgi:hypothetical protein